MSRTRGRIASLANLDTASRIASSVSDRCVIGVGGMSEMSLRRRAVAESGLTCLFQHAYRVNEGGGFEDRRRRTYCWALNVRATCLQHRNDGEALVEAEAETEATIP